MTEFQVVDLGNFPVDEATPVVSGPRGPAGTDGASAYEVAVANGFVGTEAEWLASLKGADGVGGGGGGAVASVNGEVGAVVLDAADVGARPDTYVPAWDEVTGKPAIPDSADDIGAETPAGAQAKVDTHAADTTAVHGIADTSALATTADVSAASTADRARGNHTGTQSSATISDFTEAVQDAVAALLSSGTNVTLTYDDPGNTLTVSAAGADAETMRDAIGAALVGVGNVAVTVNDAADTITVSTTATVNSTDAALRDRSTHTGTQAASTITGLGTAATKDTGTGATNVILGNDARLTDARTPTTHTHPASDLTATGTRNATTFLRGDNTWATPTGAGGTTGRATVSGTTTVAAAATTKITSTATITPAQDSLLLVAGTCLVTGAANTQGAMLRPGIQWTASSVTNTNVGSSEQIVKNPLSNTPIAGQGLFLLTAGVTYTLIFEAQSGSGGGSVTYSSVQASYQLAAL